MAEADIRGRDNLNFISKDKDFITIVITTIVANIYYCLSLSFSIVHNHFIVSDVDYLIVT